MPVSRLLSYNDLVSLGVVNNRAQLSRLQKKIGFPKGFLLSENSRRWHEHDIDEWLEGRQAVQDSQPVTKRGG